MDEWYSQRWKLKVILTNHAAQRMKERSIEQSVIRELIEKGKTKHKNEQHLWIYHKFSGRDDNLICAAAVKGSKLVIKTIMHRWELVEV